MRGGGGGGGVGAASPDHERDWPPCKVVFFGLATNALNVRNNRFFFFPQTMGDAQKV